MESHNKSRINPNLGTIGDLIEATGLSRHTIHYYEKIELIKPIERTVSNYRLYELESTIKILRFIKKSQVLHFSLTEIKNLLSIYHEHKKPCGEVRALLKKKITKVEDAISDLRSQKEFLLKVNNEWDHLSESSLNESICPLIENVHSDED